MSPRLDWALAGKQKLPVGNNTMEVGCKHKRGVTACGGCHARLYMALREVAEHPAHAAEIVEAVFTAMKAESGNQRNTTPKERSR